MLADKRYTVIIEDAQLFRIAPCKANQIFVKIYLEGSKKGKETKAATYNGNRFIFINESAEIEVDSRASSPTVLVVKVMQAGTFRNSRVGKLKIALPDVLPFERTPVRPNELKDRQGEVVGTIGVYLMLKSMTGNFMAIQRRRADPVERQEPQSGMVGANMLSCTTFASMDSSVHSSVCRPSSEPSSTSSSKATHVLMCGQSPDCLMREGTLMNQPLRHDMLQRGSARVTSSLPPAKASIRRQSIAVVDERMQTMTPLDRNITHKSNETTSSAQSRRSAQSMASMASITHFSTTSDDYPLSPVADPPKYLAQGNMEIEQESEYNLSGSQRRPSSIPTAAEPRFPPINNLPDDPIADAMYSSRFPNMDN